MPYIDKQDRELFDGLIAALDLLAKTPGEYNYIITRLIHSFVFGQKKLCYNVLNDAIGILESVKQEFYRTVVAPYEQKKKQANGSVSILEDDFKE